MKRMLNEELYLKPGSIRKKNGDVVNVVYVEDDKVRDSTYNLKDKIKQYGAQWKSIYDENGMPIKAWSWILWQGNQSPEIAQIKQFQENLGDIETTESGEKRTAEEILKNVNAILNGLQTVVNNHVPQLRANADELLGKVHQFKAQLIQDLNSPETQKAMAEYMEFVKKFKSFSNGVNFGPINSILIWLTKKDATDVRTERQWGELGYHLKPNAKPIILIYPVYNKLKITDKEKEDIIKMFLKNNNAKSEKELNPAQKERLARELRMAQQVGRPKSYRDYIAYDISDMEPGEGATEIPKNPLQWFSTMPGDQKSQMLLNACVKYGQSLGLNYNFVNPDELGGARGSASNMGDVNLIANDNTLGALSTAIHELTHQIIHWDIIKAKNPAFAGLYRGRDDKEVDARARREWEAEVSAYLVMLNYGYHLQPNVNYLKNWGLDEKKAVAIFDHVALVANEIIHGIDRFAEQELEAGNESLPS